MSKHRWYFSEKFNEKNALFQVVDLKCTEGIPPGHHRSMCEKILSTYRSKLSPCGIEILEYALNQNGPHVCSELFDCIANKEVLVRNFFKANNLDNNNNFHPRKLYNKTVNINDKFFLNQKPYLIHWAKETGCYKELSDIVKKTDIDINFKDMIGRPLLSAVLDSSPDSNNRKVIEMVEFLLTNKLANIDCKDDDGTMPFQVVASMGCYELISRLMPQEKDINYQDDYGNTALYHAVKGNHYQASKTSLDLGADVNCQNKQGVSPLHLVRIDQCHSKEDIRKLVVDKAADFENNKVAIGSQLSAYPALEQSQNDLCDEENVDIIGISNNDSVISKTSLLTIYIANLKRF